MNINKTTRLIFTILFTSSISGCNPIPFHRECYLPKLSSELEIRTIETLGPSGYFRDSCPIKVLREFELRRPWGEINLRWHGSPQRLWLKVLSNQGASNKGDILTPVSDGIKNVDDDPFNRPLRGEFNYVIDFHGRYFYIEDGKKTFTIAIKNQADVILETLTFGYETVKCTCAYYDSI